MAEGHDGPGPPSSRISSVSASMERGLRGGLWQQTPEGCKESQRMNVYHRLCDIQDVFVENTEKQNSISVLVVVVLIYYILFIIFSFFINLFVQLVS